jgi:hypothetical protein
LLINDDLLFRSPAGPSLPAQADVSTVSNVRIDDVLGLDDAPASELPSITVESGRNLER